MQAAGISAVAADDAADGGGSSSSSAHGGERIEGTQQQLLQHPQEQTSSGVLGESHLNLIYCKHPKIIWRMEG